MPFLQFGCRTIDPQDPDNYDSNGTTNTDFDRVLRYVGRGLLKIRRVKHIRMKTMKAHLAKGGAVALGYHWDDGTESGDHFCIIVGYEDGKFTVVNDHVRDSMRAVTYRTDREVQKWIKVWKDDPVAWLITRKE